MKGQNWLFITGMPRTGTTAMQELLNLHPDCLILQETHFAQGLYDLLALPPEDHRFGLPSGRELLRSLPQLQRYGSAVEIARAMCYGLRKHLGDPKVFGDKSPAHVFRWQMLRELFPDCRILCMDRDLDETAASVRRQAWGPNDISTAKAELLRYRHAIDRCPRLLWVQLEELKRLPEKVMFKVLSWLDLTPGIYPMERAIELVNGPPIN